MVLDSSACLDLLLDTGAGGRIRPLLLDPEPPLIAPGLMWIEVARVLRAKVIDGRLSRRGAEAALVDLFDLGVEEAPAEPLLVRAWQLRENMTVDDAVFVALAELTEQPLLTSDVRLARAATQHAGIAAITPVD